MVSGRAKSLCVKTWKNSAGNTLLTSVFHKLFNLALYFRVHTSSASAEKDLSNPFFNLIFLKWLSIIQYSLHQNLLFSLTLHLNLRVEKPILYGLVMVSCSLCQRKAPSDAFLACFLRVSMLMSSSTLLMELFILIRQFFLQVLLFSIVCSFIIWGRKSPLQLT